jgi:uncharacterized membrane protein YczE
VFTKKTVTRVLVYLSGLCILALGLTLSTKADLGVSPIIAVSFCISKITGARFGDMTFLLYAAFVVIEILLHLIPGKRRPEDRKKAILADVLQLPLSYFFTMLLIANPGDGLVQAVSDRAGIDLGLSKNIVDITCVTFTRILSMTVSHHLLGVGIGTPIAMIGVGRVIAFVNKLFGERLALLLSDTQL